MSAFQLRDESLLGDGRGVGLMRGLQIPQQDFALKCRRGLMREGGGGVFAGHYGTYM